VAKGGNFLDPPSGARNDSGLVAVLALVLGIVAALASLSGILYFIGLPLGGLGLALSLSLRARALRGGQPTGLLSAAVALNVVGILLGIAMYATCDRIKHHPPAAREDPKLSHEFEEAFDKAIRSHELAADGAVAP
jgi:uncharacterized membrane protein YedE/YeeE